MTIKELFNTESFAHADIFSGLTYPWEAVAKLPAYLSELLKNMRNVQEIIIGEGTVVEEGAVIKGPAVIGKNCQIRSGAYIRGNVIVGDNVVIGHASEIKNSIILDNAQLAHFNYIGDSVVGTKAHFAAGALTANTKLDRSEIKVKWDGKELATGLKKFGAAVGDGAEIGSNAVLNPGSIIGKNSVVYPLVSWRGVLEENMIAKGAKEVAQKK